VNQEGALRTEIHQALDAIGNPTPDLLPGIMSRLRPGSYRRPMMVIGQAVAVLGIGLIVGAIVFSLHRSRVTPTTVTTSPTAPIVAGPGADIAWVTSQTQDRGDVVTGVDPAGHVVGRINAPIELRSPDGAHLYAVRGGAVETYSALDGHREQTVRLQAVGGVGPIPMLSPDGRYLAVVGGPATTLELVDLSMGRSVASIKVGSAAYVPIIVGARANHIYVIGNDTVVSVAFDGVKLRVEQQTAGHTACDGLSIGGPNSAGGLPFRVLADGRTLAAFCPGDGRVTWFDLTRMAVTHEVVVGQRNPFWVSPVFSPDGTTLYLHEGGTGALHLVDLVHQRLVTSTKVAAAERNALAWLGSLLVIPADAGGISRTAAVSPDNNWLYTVGAFGAQGGVSLVHLPDLHIKGRWLPDIALESVWVSADGQTIYLLSHGGDQLRALRTDGSEVARLNLPANTYGFVVPSVP